LSSLAYISHSNPPIPGHTHFSIYRHGSYRYSFSSMLADSMVRPSSLLTCPFPLQFPALKEEHIFLHVQWKTRKRCIIFIHIVIVTKGKITTIDMDATQVITKSILRVVV